MSHVESGYLAWMTCFQTLVRQHMRGVYVRWLLLQAPSSGYIEFNEPPGVFIFYYYLLANYQSTTEA